MNLEKKHDWQIFFVYIKQKIPEKYANKTCLRIYFISSKFINCGCNISLQNLFVTVCMKKIWNNLILCCLYISDTFHKSLTIHCFIVLIPISIYFIKYFYTTVYYSGWNNEYRDIKELKIICRPVKKSLRYSFGASSAVSTGSLGKT